MPIYSYSCPRCSKKVEIIRSMSEVDDPVACDQCGGKCEMEYSTFSIDTWEPFTTCNILPDGQPVTIKGRGQLRQLEAEHGVKWLNKDLAPETVPPFKAPED